jgi:hypothetical protein
MWRHLFSTFDTKSCLLRKTWKNSWNNEWLLIIHRHLGSETKTVIDPRKFLSIELKKKQVNSKIPT